jgi:hypothetical protein
MSEEIEERPPVFLKWGSWYWLVMAVLAIQIMLYLFISTSFQ